MEEIPNFTVKVLLNPYPHVFDGTMFQTLFQSMASDTAVEIAMRFDRGEFKRNSLGLCLMDPTLPPSVPSAEGILALVAIGSEGRDYLPNAISKAIEHRDLGMDCGIAAYVQPYRLRDGSFTFGHSAETGGTIAGASGLSEEQDRYMATTLAARFNYLVTARHKGWKTEHPDNKWFCNTNEPHVDFKRIAATID